MVLSVPTLFQFHHVVLLLFCVSKYIYNLHSAFICYAWLYRMKDKIHPRIVIKVSRTVLESLVGRASITNTPQDTDLTLIKHNNIGRHWEYERIMPLKVCGWRRGPHNKYCSF